VQRAALLLQSQNTKDGNNKEMLKASQELYELRIAEYGDEHYYTIDAGMRYAYNLRKVKRETEVRDLLTKLLVTSKRVLGPHHNTTKAVDNIGVLAMLYQLAKSCHSGSLEQ
jgi:hypothetical protein